MKIPQVQLLAYYPRALSAQKRTCMDGELVPFSLVKIARPACQLTFFSTEP